MGKVINFDIFMIILFLFLNFIYVYLFMENVIDKIILWFVYVFGVVSSKFVELCCR